MSEDRAALADPPWQGDPWAEAEADPGWPPAEPPDDDGPPPDRPTGPEPQPPPGGQGPQHRGPSAASVLVRLALDCYRLGCTDSGEAFAVPRASSSSAGEPTNGAHVVRMLRGGRKSFRAELSASYRRFTGGKPAPQQALADALLALQGEAQEQRPEALHLRVAERDGAVWVDLGDESGRVVRIAGGSWAVVTEGVPVLFRRTELTGALPVPRPGGSLTALWSAVNVVERDRPLVLAWLTAAILRPGIPHPILALFGEQGAGKSSGSKTLVRLVDPSPVELRKPPRDPDGWVTAAQGSYVVGLDNLSTVSDWLSDSLCRAATGEGDVRRALYTDGGLSVFAFRRVILLNGIDVGAMRGDLAERLVTVTLDRISEGSRRTEEDLSALWDVSYPSLFGALLDLAARVAVALPGIQLAGSPRMADFARVLAAVDAECGTAGLPRYVAQARSMAEDSLDADPFLVATRTNLTRTFTGTAGGLLTLVTPVEDGWRPPRDWPKNSRQVTTILRRNAPALRNAGWHVEDQGAENKQHATVWQITPPQREAPAAPASVCEVHGPTLDGLCGRCAVAEEELW